MDRHRGVEFKASTSPATPPGVRVRTRRLRVECPLALLGSALYPVSCSEPPSSLHASFTPASRSDALRFTSLAVTSSREDFHLPPGQCPYRARTLKQGE